MSSLAARYLMVYVEPTPYIAGLVEELSKQAEGGVEVLFLKENVSQQWDLPLSGLNARILPARPADAASALYGAVSRGGYRVLHLAGWSEVPILFALITAWLHGVPVVIESDTQLNAGSSPWKRGVKRMIYPVLFRMAGMLLPGGSRQAAYFRHYRVEEERMMIAGMTVDVAGIMGRCAEMGEEGRRTARSTFGFAEDDVVFAFIGRLLEWKGVNDLLKAFEALSTMRDGVGLIIAGDGPLREAAIGAAGRNKSIRYAGRLDSTGVVTILHASDIAVFPSHMEPWGLVVNEAMAAGLPVIATDAVGCVDDLVRENITGRIVRAGSPTALAAAMGAMAEGRDERTRMGRAARTLISDWTLEREADVILRSWSAVAAR